MESARRQTDSDDGALSSQGGDGVSAGLSIHRRLSELSSSFNQLQSRLVTEPDPEHGDGLMRLAQALIDISEDSLDQVLGELFLSEVSNYNFTKPLYIAASLNELINRYNLYSPSQTVDETKRKLLIAAALGFNLGLVSYEKQIYDSDEEFSHDDKRQLRENYPQQSGDLLKASGLDQAIIQDVVRNHNVVTENPSADAMMMRTPFIYAGIAMPQTPQLLPGPRPNPSQEFARMYARRELDPVYAGLFLKINGMAPVGAILNYESREKAIVVKRPENDDISSSTVRMLTNRSGIQLRAPGEFYPFSETPSRMVGPADHHQFAWTYFAPYVMWEE